MRHQKTNSEGLTWPEWAYAAGVQEPAMLGVGREDDRFDHDRQLWIPRGQARSSHSAPGYARQFRAERRAWNSGEDPTEWRAYLKLESPEPDFGPDVFLNPHHAPL